MQLPNAASTSEAHDWFIRNLAEIQSRSHACFARLNPDLREEAVAEVMANVYQASASAARRGVLAKITPYHAVVYATKHFRTTRLLLAMTDFIETDRFFTTVL